MDTLTRATNTIYIWVRPVYILVYLANFRYIQASTLDSLLYKV